jgi:ketosteroid isomerase-like protein
MSTATAASPERTVNDLFAALDSLDVGAIEALFDDDPQGVDELSGGWRRGRGALHDYLSEVTSAGLSDIRSSPSDVHTKEWGDTALVTLVLDQTYTMGGERQAIRAPTTIVLRRGDGRWLVALVHTVPVASEE